MVKVSNYIPERGDIVWIDFDPQRGKEIQKRRPALVLSAQHYNRHGLFLACPMTTKTKGYPFELQFDLQGVNNAILTDQVKSLNWRDRRAEFIEKAPKNILSEVISIVIALLQR